MTTKQGLSESFQVSLELFQKHWKTIEKFGSCPLRRTALIFTFDSLGLLVLPGFFALLAKALAY
jgi:hypothetical protein